MREQTAGWAESPSPSSRPSGSQAARIFSELAACGAPVEWHTLAEQPWPAEKDDPAHLRRRWDVALTPLRSRLKGAGVRPDILHAAGSGLLELFLLDEGVVEDRT